MLWSTRVCSNYLNQQTADSFAPVWFFPLPGDAGPSRAQTPPPWQLCFKWNSFIVPTFSHLHSSMCWYHFYNVSCSCFMFSRKDLKNAKFLTKMENVKQIKVSNRNCPISLEITHFTGGFPRPKASNAPFLRGRPKRVRPFWRNFLQLPFVCSGREQKLLVESFLLSPSCNIGCRLGDSLAVWLPALFEVLLLFPCVELFSELSTCTKRPFQRLQLLAAAMDTRVCANWPLDFFESFRNWPEKAIFTQVGPMDATCRHLNPPFPAPFLFCSLAIQTCFFV